MEAPFKRGRQGPMIGGALGETDAGIGWRALSGPEPHAGLLG